MRQFLYIIAIVVILPVTGVAQLKSSESTPNYANSIGIDILPSTETTSLRMWASHGNKINENLSVGIGLGFTYYNDPLSLLPLFFDLRYELPTPNATPFIYLKSGYNFPVRTSKPKVDDQNGGLMLNPGVGLKFKQKGNFCWHVNLGYNLDKAKYEQDFGAEVVKTNITYKRFMIGAGIAF